MAIPVDGSVESEYADGYIHSETDHKDVSPYTGTDNIFNDILEKRPEAEHGKMVGFSVYYKNQKHTVDWTTLPENARPIRWKRIEADSVGGGITEVRLMQVGFGYQFRNADGKNIKEVKEL